MSTAQSRIVVTGASGYIGTALVNRLAADKHALRLVTRHRGEPVATEGIETVAADLSEDGAWDDLLGDASAVVHLSARTNLRAAESDPEMDEHLNVRPVRNLVAAAARRHAPLVVVFASTVTIAGDRPRLPVDEETTDDPITVYDRHKLDCEALLGEATRHGLLRSCTLRLSNVYGHGALSKVAERGILNVMVRRAVRGEPLTIFGDGRSLRDYIHLGDVVDAFRRALETPATQSGRAFVICSGEGRSLAEAFGLIAREASQLTGRPVEVRHLPEPPDLHRIERRDFVGNPGLFRRLAGWEPRTSFQAGIRADLERLTKLSEEEAIAPTGPIQVREDPRMSIAEDKRAPAARRMLGRE